MSASDFSYEMLDEMGEEFAERLRRGENPVLEEYADRFPQHASEIKEFLESVAMLEELKHKEPTPPKKAARLSGEFGRYQILKLLGEGGMGAVYLARDTQLDRKVALKTPKFAESADTTLVERFIREARAAATLQHPNICPVFEIGDIEGVHYISMAYIEGHPLSAYVKISSGSAINAAVRVVRKVALAIQEAHSKGIVHRDLKPGNIMIDQRNEPIVMDFGLARRSDDENHSAGEQHTHPNVENLKRLTQDGMLLGSPGYMSPEQILGEDIGPASDIFSLAVVLFELLTGKLPFQGDGSHVSMLSATLNGEPASASQLRPEVDARLDEICRRALNRNPEQRFDSMQSFAKALGDCLKSKAGDPTTANGLGLALPEHQAIDLGGDDPLGIADTRSRKPQGTIAEPFRRPTPTAAGNNKAQRWVIITAVTVIGLSILFSPWIIRRLRSTPNRKTATSTPETKPQTAPADSQQGSGETRPFPQRGQGNGNRMSPIERLRRLDANRDGKISKAELSRRRPTQYGALNRIAERFDFFDRNPRDGQLDEAEIEFMARVISRSMARENQFRRGPRPN